MSKKIFSAKEKLKIIMSDSKLYIESFMKIVDKNGKLVPFRLNEMQQNLYEKADKYNVVLKARQGGMSVYVLAKALYLSLSQPNTHCMMLSHNMESTRNIFNKAKQLYDSIPDSIKPALIKNNRQELGFTNGSILSCNTLSKKDNGRGATLRLIHVSELAFVGEQAKTQLLSLEQALVPNGELYIESTANGMGNYFNQVWNQAKNKESMYIPQFYSYLDTADMFVEDHKKVNEIYERLNGKKFSEDDLTIEEIELMNHDDRFTLNIILWRRMKINNSSEDEFNQEFPLTDTMAFINSGSSVFDSKKVNERLLHLPKSLKKTVVGKSNPLYFHFNSGLEVFHRSEPNHKYSIGVDGSEGVGGDSSTITVIDVTTDIEVAHYNNNKISPHKFAELVYQMAQYYNDAFVVVEKASGGIVVLDNLKNKFKYTNIYKAKQFDERGKSKKRVGFVTNEKTRPILINNFRQAFDEGEVLINSKRTLQEMLTFVADKNNKIQHSRGSHDDSLFSFMLALFGCSQPHYK